MDLSLKVYQNDVDWGGILYHANYLHFFDQARTEWWSDIGFAGHLFGKESLLAFAIADIHIKYISPAFLHDELTIKTRLQSLKNTSLLFKQSMWRKEICLADAESVLVCVNIHDGRPANLPPDMLKTINKIII